MGDFFNKSLREIIELSSSSAPVPGGGSVSAIVACLGAAMTAMVCNLTTGKEKYRDVEPHVQEINNSLSPLLAKLEYLVEEDMAEFQRFMSAYRLPRDTEEQKAAREEALQGALRGSTEIPLEIARTCLVILQLTQRLSGIGNKMAISDAGVAATITEAALNSVLLTASGNVPLIKDAAMQNVWPQKLPLSQPKPGKSRKKL